jgi:hypothetical protein
MCGRGEAIRARLSGDDLVSVAEVRRAVLVETTTTAKAAWPAARRDQRRRPATTTVRSEEPHPTVWNDSVPPFDEQDVRARQPDNPEGVNPMTDRLLGALRRLDTWTLIVFNPRLPSDRGR